MDGYPLIDLDVLWGQPASQARNCTSASGRIEVCNSKYGTTGWLSITSLSVSGDHITKAAIKLNDTYVNTAPYNASLRLGYQDTIANKANLGSCMDTTDDPDGGTGGLGKSDSSPASTGRRRTRSTSDMGGDSSLSVDGFPVAMPGCCNI